MGSRRRISAGAVAGSTRPHNKGETMKVWLTHSDGQYGLRPAEDNDPDECCIEIRESVYHAYLAWVQQGTVFDALFTTLDNEKCVDQCSHEGRPFCSVCGAS